MHIGLNKLMTSVQFFPFRAGFKAHLPIQMMCGSNYLSTFNYLTSVLVIRLRYLEKITICMTGHLSMESVKFKLESPYLDHAIVFWIKLKAKYPNKY